MLFIFQHPKGENKNDRFDTRCERPDYPSGTAADHISDSLDQVKKWTAVGVKAAEMIYKESGMGEAKKNYVRKFLESKGYKLDIDTVDALIEATVREMQQEAFETTAVPSLPDAEDDEAEELI